MEQPSENPPLIELRELYEAQDPVRLIAMKSIHLMRMRSHQHHLHTIDEVLDGYGYTRQGGENEQIQ